MSRWMKSGLALAALSMTLALRAPAQMPTPGVVPGVREIRMTAKHYKYNPFVITVKQGDRVTLIVTAVDHSYGFKLKEFKIDEKVQKGESTTIHFTADKMGNFTYECGLFCGMGHRMKGTLVVQ